MTSAEAWAVGAVAMPAGAILLAYLLDVAGIAFTPWLVLALSVFAAGTTWRVAQAGARETRADTATFWSVVSVTSAWLLWLAWPTLLPLSTGPDLTHHLILIHYIEQHWRLVHDPSLERSLGEMAQYTAGSHILAALAGAWSGSDGLRALHPVQAIVVALKAGFLWLIARRILPATAPRPLALTAVVLLLAAPRYALGAFTEYGFVAQVVAELFTIVMWWSIVAWDRETDWRLCLVFGAAGAATFLTWPVYSGAPALALALVMIMRVDVPLAIRARHAAIAVVPFGGVAAAYLVGRLGWLQLAGTGGAAPSPSVAAFSAPLVILAAAGLAVGLFRRRARATVLFTAAVIAEAASFFVIAHRAHAPQPYMTLKMFYLLLWPMAALGAAAIGEAWSIVTRGLLHGRLDDRSISRRERTAGWVAAAVVFLLAVRPIVAAPRTLHPLPPATSLPLYDAGRWARTNLPAGCIEYLVGDDETAYWLHLAVLGNPRMSPRTGDNATYEPQQAILRWLTPGGLPYGIADLPAVPASVRGELDIVRQFGTAAIVKRRGAASCGTGLSGVPGSSTPGPA